MKHKCKHGIPHPAYVNCDECRFEMDREDEEADAMAAKWLEGCDFPASPYEQEKT